jgi:hypothetical protein
MTSGRLKPGRRRNTVTEGFGEEKVGDWEADLIHCRYEQGTRTAYRTCSWRAWHLKLTRVTIIWVKLGVGYKYDGGGDYWLTPAEAASDQ